MIWKYKAKNPQRCGAGLSDSIKFLEQKSRQEEITLFWVRFLCHKRKDKGLHLHRVSTTMQIDGYSLDAQKARMKAYADFNDYQIVGEYEDAGKSGKSIEGRASFCRMMEDIKSGKD